MRELSDKAELLLSECIEGGPPAQKGSPVWELREYLADLEELAKPVAGKPAEVASARDAVLGMRDTFLQLVAAYNHVHCFEDARDSQIMAIALHKFEENHNITSLAWPLQPMTDDDGPGLMSTEGRPLSREDL